MKNQAFDHIRNLVSYMIEQHMEAGEYETNHQGDADHGGEAPEVCSYCTAIRDARDFLAAKGEDVSALTPEEE
jgi:hypothetical protein